MEKPLKNIQKLKSYGLFGAKRKHDVHTGVDLYANVGDDVYAIEDGCVIRVDKFTGPEVFLPWWNTTYYVGISTRLGYIVYGEIEPSVKIGQFVKAGDKIGTVMQVLKKDKGLPMSMLHLELYSEYIDDPVVWKHGKDKHGLLLNPLNILPSVFNHDASSLEEAIYYFVLRENQLSQHGYAISNVEKVRGGVIAYFTSDHGQMYCSYFVFPAFRGKGLYKKTILKLDLPVLTVDDCNIVDFLKFNDIDHKVVKI